MIATFAETHLRALVADTLGVDAEDLSPEVSLVDDLAVDSLDLAELVVRVEGELGVAIADRVVDRIRTYADLVRAALTASRTAHPVPTSVDDVLVRARLVSPHGEILRAESLTPYAVETIADDAVAAGRGAALEITLPTDTSEADLGSVRARLAWLVDHGVALHVMRENGTRRSAAA